MNAHTLHPAVPRAVIALTPTAAPTASRIYGKDVEAVSTVHRYSHLPLAEQGQTEIGDRFRQLAERWKRETMFWSSATRMNAHPDYQEIVAMGPRVVPLLLADLEREGDHWFAALRLITGENPVPAESRGKPRIMTEAWLKWGKEHGY